VDGLASDPADPIACPVRSTRHREQSGILQQFSETMRQIASVGEPTYNILQGDGFERSGDSVVESSLGPGFMFTDERFEFREGLLDGIEVRTG
jgi:hypothetical protein